MERLNQRQGFLVSAVVHLMILSILGSGPVAARLPPETPAERQPEPVSQRIFLPPASVLRQILPAPPPAPRPAVPRPTPPPPAAETKDKISIGPPSEERAKGPLVLRREDDLTATPKGRPDAGRDKPEPPATAPPAPAAGVPAADGRPGLRLPPGLDGTELAGEDGSRPRPGPSSPSIASALRDFERRLQVDGTRGLPTGTGRQMGPLFFDPEGADFTLWINHFKNEVYRNWIVPQPALLGFRGHVDLEFTVERDGRLTNLKLLKSSGTSSLDRAAQNALLGSRLLPLPADYGPARVPMQVTFYYNEGPQGS